MRPRGAIFVAVGVSLAVMVGTGWRFRSLVSRKALPMARASASRPSVSAAFGRLPLSFEENQGQFDPRVLYAARAPGETLFFTRDGLTLALPQLAVAAAPSPDPAARFAHHRKVERVVALTMAFDGANPTPVVEASEHQAGIKNYLIGRDPAHWHTHVPLFGKIAYRGLYPGVDLVFHGAEGQLEYDLEVAPDADVRQIRFRFEGADRVEEVGSDVVVHAGPFELRQPRLHVYDTSSEGRRELAAGYRVDDGQWISFDVPGRAARHGLLIDPVLAYSTYLGGSGPGDWADSIAVDLAGSAYVAGYATSIDFPTTDGAFQAQNPQGGPAVVDNPVSTVTKLDPTGSSLVYSTYIGGAPVGPNHDGGTGGVAGEVVVTDGGFAYVVGQTYAPDFPVTPGAAQTAFRGAPGLTDGYVLELAPEGDRLVYCTFVGGSDLDAPFGLALDSEGNAYTGGYTLSRDFPTTPNALQPSYGGGPSSGFFVKLSTDGSRFVYSSYFGGSGIGAYNEAVQGIKVDVLQQPVLSGYTVSSDIPGHELSPIPFQDGGGGDIFLTKLTSDGQHQIFFTYLGGSGVDFAWDLGVDALGNSWMAGQTGSADFPVTRGAIQKDLANPPDNVGNGPFDAFIAVLNPAGALLYATYLGGNGDDRALGIALDAQGHTHVVGFTTSTDLVTKDDLRGEHDESLGLAHAPGGDGDMFLADFTIDGGLDFLTYLGGSGQEVLNFDSAGTVAVDSFGGTYVVGSSASTDFPVTEHAFQKKNNAPAGVPNMVVVKVVPTPPPCTLTSLQPDHGTYLGLTVDAQGTNLSRQDELDFGGTPSGIITATPDQLQVGVAPHACGVVDVTLICPGSPPSSLPDGFTFEGCPDAGPPDAGPVDAGPADVGDGGMSSGCGCASTSVPVAASWILGLALLAMVPRGRQRRHP